MVEKEQSSFILSFQASGSLRAVPPECSHSTHSVFVYVRDGWERRERGNGLVRESELYIQEVC